MAVDCPNAAGNNGHSSARPSKLGKSCNLRSSESKCKKCVGIKLNAYCLSDGTAPNGDDVAVNVGNEFFKL